VEPEAAVVTSKASYRGVIYGIAAYGLWGLIPLYFKAVAKVAPPEVLAHRALWSFVLLAVLVRLMGRWAELWRELHSPKLMAILGLNAFLMAANWLMFIYAVTTGQTVQASLGYFINPLVNVLLGVVFLRERLRPLQMLSIALAAVGVLVLAGWVGKVPWIALTLAGTFALYALMRKKTPVDGLASVTVETLLMTPLALAYLGYLATTDNLTGTGLGTIGLLTLSGLCTTVPLLCFAAAARRLPLSTLGILQYLTPTLQFLVAVVAFGEPFTLAQKVSFACIWTAIGIYTADSYRAVRQARLDVIEPFGADP
jgi:chloramphenicol-sensitive protein RarD